MQVSMDDETYRALLCFLDNQHCTEKPAAESNLVFLKNDWWLADTAVIETIHYHKGGWEVFLTFANYQKPCQLIVRKIIRCYHEGKAKTIANYMRRMAAKDQRGSLSVEIKDLNLCTN
ncbi:MAG: hypothetical protein JST58_11420 [Bacteroidetes bacterium]|nr:hypothetical protein [Bacteroidota bacterium]